MRRLKRSGWYEYIGDIIVRTSMRRYEHDGVSALWMWLKLWFKSFFGDLHQRHYSTVR